MTWPVLKGRRTSIAHGGDRHGRPVDAAHQAGTRKQVSGDGMRTVSMVYLLASGRSSVRTWKSVRAYRAGLARLGRSEPASERASSSDGLHNTPACTVHTVVCIRRYLTGEWVVGVVRRA